MTEKNFYVVTIDFWHLQDVGIEEASKEKTPIDLSDEEFKKIAELQDQVYTPDELCEELNNDRLDLEDGQIRYL